ncbi:MAG: hypothetical protein ACYC1Z_14830 [Georgenia sp.]
MVVRRSFEWDVLAQPSPNAWLDDLRDQGWTRVPGLPGVATDRGTVVYQLEHAGPAGAAGAGEGAVGVRAIAWILLASAVEVVVIVAGVLAGMAIVQS